MSLTGAGLRNMKAVPSYRTVGAICEVVDNAIQYLNESRGLITVNFISGDNGRVSHIVICDNGRGFQQDSEGKEILDYCLWFGGGSNIDSTEGLGKYGVGLPFACCNQSSDYKVYSWREIGKIRSVGRKHARFRDNDPVIEETSSETTLANVDRMVQKVASKFFQNNSGTVVFWKDCDNLEYVKASTLIYHVSNALERVYRNFLSEDIKIEMISWIEKSGFITQDKPNCYVLEPFDPLFTSSNRLTMPHYNSAPSFEHFNNIEKPITIEHPIGVKHEFIFRASIAKEDVQHPNNLPGGNSELGRLYNRHLGISLLREGRELNMGYFGFFQKSKSDTRVRWYKGELSFKAISDALMGVTPDKSRAVAFKYTDDDHHDPELASSDLMHKLTQVIESVLGEIDKIVVQRAKDIRRAQRAIRCHRCRTGTIIEGRCDNEECGTEVMQCNKCGSILQDDGKCMECIIKTPSVCPVHAEPYTSDGYCFRCGAPEKLSDEEKIELLDVLKIYEDFQSLTEVQVNNMLQWFVASGKKHFLLFLPNKLNPHELISYKKFQHSDVTFVIINKEHPFYTVNVEPLLLNENDESIELLNSIIMLFINWARTENEMIDPSNAISLFRTRFGSNLSASMNNWYQN